MIIIKSKEAGDLHVTTASPLPVDSMTYILCNFDPFLVIQLHSFLQ
jgi:hypothetical protein